MFGVFSGALSSGDVSVTDAEKPPESNRIALLGLGGGGGRIAAAFAGLGEGLPCSVAIADTDRAALGAATAGVATIALGPEWTNHEGCGGDTALGERAASAASAELTELLADAKLLVVLAGLGGGTGSGAARVVARLAREADVTSLFLVTLPFAFEGGWRRREAEKSLTALRELVDAVITVPNDLLFTALSADTPAPEAFRLADSLLAQGVAGLAHAAAAQALVPADFAALRSVLRHPRTTCALAVGHSADAGGWESAIDAFLECPLLGGRSMLGQADAAVLTLLGGPDLAVGDVQGCLAALQEQFPESARLVVGACTDERVRGRFEITGLLCKYAGTPPDAGSHTHAGERAAAPAAAAARRGESRQIQGELPLQEQSLGGFSGVPPTTVAGQNLDIPTFQRRGVQLDIGD